MCIYRRADPGRSWGGATHRWLLERNQGNMLQTQCKLDCWTFGLSTVLCDDIFLSVKVSTKPYSSAQMKHFAGYIFPHWKVTFWGICMGDSCWMRFSLCGFACRHQELRMLHDNGLIYQKSGNFRVMKFSCKNLV